MGCVEDCRVASFGFFDEEGKEFRSNQNVQVNSDLYLIVSYGSVGERVREKE